MGSTYTHCLFIRLINKIEFKLSLILIVFIAPYCIASKRKSHNSYRRQTQNPYTKTICMDLDNTLRARRKTCFLRPDTGPCRADIVQWYFDVKRRKCYRFFWGGCQGNGNRFESQKECFDYCYLNTSKPICPEKAHINVIITTDSDNNPVIEKNREATRSVEIPHFCSLAFDYGTCFGYFNRWGWDTFSKTCKRRLYSGCGGNQNNFESRAECLSTCLSPPNNTLMRVNKYTTCVPYHIAELQ